MNKQQKFLIALVLTTTAYLLITIYRYWYADILYAKAKSLNRSDNPTNTLPLISSALKISSKEPYYHVELSEFYTRLALASKDLKSAEKAIEEIKISTKLSPANVNLKRAEFSMYVRLSLIDPKYLPLAANVLEEAIKMAPTDAKLFYNLSLAYAQTGQPDKAIAVIQKTIDLKPNYKEARLAYALFLIDKGEKTKAKEELTYILEKIDPNDSKTKQQLEELNPAP